MRSVFLPQLPSGGGNGEEKGKERRQRWGLEIEGSRLLYITDPLTYQCSALLLALPRIWDGSTRDNTN